MQHVPGLWEVAGMEISLKGKVALVTGASRGIGRAIATTYAEAGAAVMLSSRKQDALEAAAGEIGGAAGETAVFAANAGEPDQIAACVAATIEQFGRVDILVNNAATNPYMGRPIDIDLPRFDKTWQVNYRGPVVWVQEVWRASMAEHGGAIVNVASVGGLSVETSIGHYNVTKAALIHLTRTMAMDLAPHVQDIANAALFLASDLSSWVTGQTIVVDGGALLGGFT